MFHRLDCRLRSRSRWQSGPRRRLRDRQIRGGRFIFPVLPSGTYSVKVTASGFTPSVTNNVIVTVGAKIALSISLSIESASEQITVNTEVPVVDTARTTVAESVNARQVAELPINGRNFLDFTLLT